MSEQSRFVRVAGVVADFGSPFFDEERQRDVWNEGSAVGLQVALWGSGLASTLSVWLGGRDALPYAALPLVVAGLAGQATTSYAEHQGVRVLHRGWVSWRRGLLWLLVVVAFVLGCLRAGGGSPGLVTGMAVGALLGTLTAAVVLHRQLAPPDDAADDDLSAADDLSGADGPDQR